MTHIDQAKKNELIMNVGEENLRNNVTNCRLFNPC